MKKENNKKWIINNFFKKNNKEKEKLNWNIWNKDNIKSNKKKKFQFQFIDNITNKVSSIDSNVITISVNVLFIIILLVIWYMSALTYREYKTNIISVNNLNDNIRILNNSYNILKNKQKDISKLVIYDKSERKNYSYLLYIIENILKQSAHYIDNNFFITTYDYNKANETIKVDITWIKYYNDIKRILFHLRKYNDFFIIKQINVKFIEKKEWNKIENYYNINLLLKYVNL